jgi:hypothetical protein
LIPPESSRRRRYSRRGCLVLDRLGAHRRYRGCCLARTPALDCNVLHGLQALCRCRFGLNRFHRIQGRVVRHGIRSFNRFCVEHGDHGDIYRRIVGLGDVACRGLILWRVAKEGDAGQCRALDENLVAARADEKQGHRCMEDAGGQDGCRPFAFAPDRTFWCRAEWPLRRVGKTGGMVENVIFLRHVARADFERATRDRQVGIIRFQLG